MQITILKILMGACILYPILKTIFLCHKYPSKKILQIPIPNIIRCLIGSLAILTPILFVADKYYHWNLMHTSLLYSLFMFGFWGMFFLFLGGYNVCYTAKITKENGISPLISSFVFLLFGLTLTISGFSFV